MVLHRPTFPPHPPLSLVRKLSQMKALSGGTFGFGSKAVGMGNCCNQNSLPQGSRLLAVNNPPTLDCQTTYQPRKEGKDIDLFPEPED
jgi:hypothetical protein